MVKKTKAKQYNSDSQMCLTQSRSWGWLYFPSTVHQTWDILQIAFWSKQTLKHNISFNREKRREKNEKTATKRSKHGPEQLIEVLKVSQKEREKTCIL